MFKNQNGVVPILLLLSALGLVATLVILSTFSFDHKLFNKMFVREQSYASSDTIQIVDDQGNPITSTNNATVKLKLTSPTWSPLAFQQQYTSGTYLELKRFYNKTIGDHWSTTTNQDSSITSDYTKEGSQGYLLASDDGKSGVVPFYDCAKTNSLGKIDHQNVLDATKCSKPVLLGYIYKTAPSNLKSSLLYGCQNLAKTDVLSSRSPLSGTAFKQQYPIYCGESTQNYIYQGNYGYTLSSLPTSTPTTVTTTSVVLAEDPNFINKQTLPFTTNLIIYTFSNPTPGTKTLYAKFIASDGREQNATPFPATVQLVSPAPTPITTPQTPTPAPTPGSSYFTPGAYVTPQ